MMKKTLVLYYSRSGRTKKLAQSLKNLLDADIIEISDNIERKGFFGLLRTMRAELKNIKSEIFPKDLPITDYELVLLGSPVWGGMISKPILALYEEYKPKLTNTAVFVTCNSGLSEIGYDLVNNIIGLNEVSSPNVTESIVENTKFLEVKKRELSESSLDKKIQSFVNGITK